MLDKDWLLTYAPLGVFDSEDHSWGALGAGVFVYDHPFTWYITANHLIRRNSEASFHILISHSKTSHHLIDIKSLHKQHGIGWVTDEANDIAATLFPSNSDFIIKAVSPSCFMSSKDMLPSMICYSVGCPYGFAGFDVEKVMPCVQDGIISGIDEIQRRVYVTAPIFPGNNGGPLFVCKQPTQTNGSQTTPGLVVYLGGIISEYALIPNGSKQENTAQIAPSMHLGIVIPSEAILELLKTENSQMMKKKLKNK